MSFREGNRPFERAAQLTFISMCLVVTAAGIKYLSVSGPGRAATKEVPTLGVGSLLPSVDRFNPNHAAGTIVLVLSTECHFCTASMPFYSRLGSLHEVVSGAVRVTIASLQPKDVMLDHLRQQGVALVDVLELNQTALRISATPTIFLADRSGRIRDIWEGQLRTDQEKEVAAAVSRIASGNQQ